MKDDTNYPDYSNQNLSIEHRSYYSGERMRLNHYFSGNKMPNSLGKYNPKTINKQVLDAAISRVQNQAIRGCFTLTATTIAAFGAGVF